MMETIFALIGPLSVTGRAVVGLIVVLLVLLALVGLTRLLTGWRVALTLWTSLAVAAGLTLLYAPVDTSGLTTAPDPAADYDAALVRFEADLAGAPEPLNPLCVPQILSRGERAETVVVLVHGVSSCPRAFVDFAPLLFERGHTVMTVRMPQNGFADRATDALSRLTAEQLADFGDDIVDVAVGLGEELVVLGISAGGTVAGWTAQNRAEVDRAVLTAPFYGLGNLGPRINVALMRAMLLLPEVSLWKDPVARENFEGGMAHAYKRQSSRGTAEIMRLGLATYRQAREGAPLAQEIVVVTNDADTAVSNVTTEAVVGAWVDQGASITRYEFAAEHGLGHELIDPQEPGADPDLTYPVLVNLIEGGQPVAAR